MLLIRRVRIKLLESRVLESTVPRSQAPSDGHSIICKSRITRGEQGPRAKCQAKELTRTMVDRDWRRSIRFDVCPSCHGPTYGNVDNAVSEGSSRSENSGTMCSELNPRNQPRLVSQSIVPARKAFRHRRLVGSKWKKRRFPSVARVKIDRDSLRNTFLKSGRLNKVQVAVSPAETADTRSRNSPAPPSSFLEINIVHFRRAQQFEPLGYSVWLFSVWLPVSQTLRHINILEIQNRRSANGSIDRLTNGEVDSASNRNSWFERLAE